MVFADMKSLIKIKHMVLSRIQFWLPVLVLLICLPATFLIWQAQKAKALHEQKLRFEYRVQDATDLISQHLRVQEQALLGLRSFFRASTFVSDAEFRDYASVVRDSSHPGLESLSFIKRVSIDSPDSYILLDANWQQVLNKINAASEAKELAPVLYTEPLSASKSGRLDDAFAHTALKKALLGAAALDATVLAVDRLGDEKQLSIFLCLPVYDNASFNLPEVDKKNHVYGWVLAKIDSAYFFSTILKPVTKSDLVVSLVDNANARQQHLFSSGNAREALFTKHQPINTFGSQWSLIAQSSPAFENSIDFAYENAIGLLGALTSVGVAVVLYLLLARMHTIRTIKHVNERLSISEQRWQFALEGAGDGVWDWDLETGRVLFSKRWKEMFGFQENELRDDIDIWKFRIHPEAYTPVMQKLEDALKGLTDAYVAEYQMQCKDGSWKWILDRGMVVARDSTGKPMRMVGTHADISTLKESEEAVWQHANFDALTGLPNRRMLYGRLDQEIQKAKRTGQKVALIFLDLDRFKEVNDTQGHDQGDLLLNLTAERLVQCMRGSDVVARLGGDEFVLLVGGVDPQDLSQVENIAQKVIAALSEPFQLDYERAYVSASLGMAIYPDDANTVEDLMKCVDQAMYASKRKGGACFTYFMPHMQEVAQHRMQLSNDLRHALTKQELFIEYQPIVNLQTGEVYKAEALLRWRHPVHGLVSPVEFIPIAEETRLILEIGDWVFQQAIQQALLWRDKLHPQFQLTVNKSPVQFNEEDNQHRGWLSTVKAFNKPAEFLVVEITEGLLLDASQKVQSRLIEFQKMGIQVALDDFGTGYSSLSYLKKFDIDYLKIDRSFVTHLDENSDDLVLCEAIIVMAHRLGMKVIAEGIETEAQMQLLKRAGCDYGQGYFFSRPISVEVFESFAVKKPVTKKKVRTKEPLV